MTVLTLAQKRGAKPAAYTGCYFNIKKCTLVGVCWPAAKIPKVGLVVLIKRNYKSKEAAVAAAARELARRAKKEGWA